MGKAMNLTTTTHEWRPARRSEVRCARCNVHFAEGCVPPPVVSGPYDGAHVCARCREELGLGEAVPLF